MDRFKNIRTCSPLYPSVDPLPPLYLGSRIQIVQSSRQYSNFLKTPNKMLQGQQNITRIRFRAFDLWLAPIRTYAGGGQAVYKIGLFQEVDYGDNSRNYR